MQASPPRLPLISTNSLDAPEPVTSRDLLAEVPGPRFSTRLSDTEAYGEPPPELSSVLNSLYLVKVEVDIEQERLCFRFFVL